jgi:hypothetical protein
MQVRSKREQAALAILPGSLRPIRELMECLPRLRVDANGQPDFLGSSPSLLVAIAEHADDLAGAFSRGMSALGVLIAHASVEIEDGTFGFDAVESVGWLNAEIAACTAMCIELSTQCRRANGLRNAGNLGCGCLMPSKEPTPRQGPGMAGG